MSKSTSIFVCQSCGAQSRQFFGRCSSCGDWNSLIEQFNHPRSKYLQPSTLNSSSNQSLLRSESIQTLKEGPLTRFSSGFKEFDRVLGGGVVPGSLILVGGNPGIGKSTLLLQTATYIATRQSVLYVTAEESAQQVRLRWQRLHAPKSTLKILAETDLAIVLEEISNLKPSLVIIDSIQALHEPNLSSTAGSVSQVRECSSALQHLAKQQETALILVGHVTKEGVLAGPKVLEHLVDAVLTFEGDRFACHRILRAVKNRYGATYELGIFEMHEKGLVEVTNPSELFLSDESASGVSTIVACEGSRSLVVDLQALVSSTTYSSPRRTATGININRIHQILAVLEKKIGLALSRYDCYLAVAGGLEVEEPAADLGIALAIASSFKNIIIPRGTVLIGELGLAGQLRPVSQLSQRLEEAKRLGFDRAVVPSKNILNNMQNEIGIEILDASNIDDAIIQTLGKDLKQ